MSGQPFLTSDNGFGFLRTGPNTFPIKWTGDPAATGGAHPNDHLHYDFGSTVQPAAFNDPSKVTIMPNYNADVDYRAYSGDGGLTWTIGHDTAPSGYAFRGVVGKDGTYNWLVDEDGSVWTTMRNIASGHVWMVKSADYTMTTWTPVFDFQAIMGFTPALGVYVSDGYVWSISGATPAVLHRVTTAGAGHASWSVGSFSFQQMVAGWPRTGRLVSWVWAEDFPTSVPVILSIDISDPLAPSWTVTGTDPFGSKQIVWDIAPLTNQILIALAVDDTAGVSRDLAGSIWRSTDGGATWTNVVANTTNLGVSYITAGVGFDNEIQAVAPDPTDANHVWVALCPPYVYHSGDQGATWDVETVDVSQCDSYGGDRPYEWMGISVVRAASVAARRRAWAQLVS